MPIVGQTWENTWRSFRHCRCDLKYSLQLQVLQARVNRALGDDFRIDRVEIRAYTQQMQFWFGGVRPALPRHRPPRDPRPGGPPRPARGRGIPIRARVSETSFIAFNTGLVHHCKLAGQASGDNQVGSGSLRCRLSMTPIFRDPRGRDASDEDSELLPPSSLSSCSGDRFL